MLAYLWRFLHLLFAFSFVGAVTLAEWNGRAARVTGHWGQRAALWRVVRTTTRVLGLGALVLAGLLGNLLAASLEHPMGGMWMGFVNALWLVGLLVYLFVALPTVGRLASLSETAARAEGGPEAAAGVASGYDATLARWRLAYVLLGIFYVIVLALMVLRRLTP